MRWLLVLLFACSAHHAPDAAVPDDGPLRAHVGPPANIVFVLVDDLDRGVYAKMPRLATLLDAQGTSFTNAIVSLSLCCPSRATILRGQYAHNTNIYENRPPRGGFEAFHAAREEEQTVATWLHDAGYRTALFGKYLNGYPNTVADTYVPPGWSEWYSPVAGTPYNEYKYSLDENGTVVPYDALRTDPTDDYLVDVMSAKATDFIQRAVRDNTPFFMYVATFAPHAPGTPPPRYETDFFTERAPRTASFQELDMSDKPSWLRDHPPLTDTQLHAIDLLYRHRLESMEAVEDLVQSLVDTLTDTGAIDNTYIVFMSDNGFHMGQHRLIAGKNTEFDEDLLVPLVVRGPGVAAGEQIDAPVVNVDLAPTFLDLADAPMPRQLDGRSLVPLWAGSTAEWRVTSLLEHGTAITQDIAPLPGTLEPPDVPGEVMAAPGWSNEPSPFVGARSARYTYIEYENGDREVYDHVLDPDQLVNAYGAVEPQILDKLHATIAALQSCAGDACRRAELQ
jgi:N-acetylglucosamine-6-sulfatase